MKKFSSTVNSSHFQRNKLRITIPMHCQNGRVSRRASPRNLTNSIMTFSIIFTTILLLAGGLDSAQGANILILHPLNLRGQSSFLRPLAHALAHRNHSVTVLSGEPDAFDESLVEVIPVWNLKGQVGIQWENSKSHFMSDIFRTHRFTSTNLRVILGSSQIQKALVATSSNRSFDAVISSSFLYFQSLAAFPHRYNALAIEFIPQADNPMTTLWSGSTIPSVPPVSNGGVLYNYIRRAEHIWKTAVILLYNRFVIIPEHQSIIDETCRYDGYEARPALHRLLSTKSLILSHGHSTLSTPVSVPLFQKHVAGISISVSKPPVPKKFQDFISGSDFGFVLLSWGTLTSSSDGPVGDAILEALGRIKERVIWKTSRANFSTPIPDNVMLSNWIPQESLLGDKRIKLFLTHGGFSSMVETVHYGVPVIVTPSSLDQPKNAAHMVSTGMGLLMSYENITVDSLVWSINEVITNPKYKRAATDLSNKFKTRLVPPTDEAIFWVENAIKFNTVVPSELNHSLTIFLVTNLDVFLVTLIGLMALLLVSVGPLRRRLPFFKSKGKCTVKNNKIE